MKKLTRLLLPILLVMFAVVGCGQNNTTKNSANKNNTKIENKDAEKSKNKENNKKFEEQSKEETKTDKEIYPMTVKDAHGTEITLESKPEKIVSLTLGTDEMLLSIVEQNRILALSGAIAEDKGISNVADKAKDFDKAENNIEKVISLNPDIVFAANWMKKEQLDQMRDAGIKVYCYGTASDIESQKNVVMEIAKVVGEEEKGKELVDEMDNKIKEISESLKELKEEDKVRVMSYNSFGSTNAKGTTFDDIVKKAGCINAATEAGLESWANISKEKIIEINPDIIIVPAWSYDEKKDPKDFADSILNDESLKEINAVKNGKVIMLADKHMNCVSQYIVYGVEDLAKAVYPELFK